MTGEECPNGNAVFQTTFVEGPNATGAFATSATPDPLTPRNMGHSPAVATIATASNIRIPTSYRKWEGQ
jgi:hypothetical protein